ncbi:hypothetical protein YPPY66_3982 [Yersinia pestis PY-66]|uniref:Uncharacterized protein n=2 Tax=Yersinia pseudotuberculosis complex TaxID=1649845 RepID=A0A0U1QXK0_YERP3|nr:hypothetical protein YpsIP31758_3146 [Yersinia pseudotuberculosis IP 31758]ABX86945.1 hypothetical protein YpAngola_A3297 [Yersinia pestis Angola]EDR34724.1 hypothetical protein YPIP275_3675 [Yersinia pestis biovar Orientalis str. IP275]EDR38726.1 hypothetical protein YpF1991016_3152 [Yersinia pestis biovar Orientalis str. F1991016]EDR42334.1 hypothetical protein YpE1979001_0069 [Yersinia pestis biovar Antiqua str. E1979001]EDR50250.1 hypothetical protein YpB42003004_3402 [Yersinia pestis b
MDGSPDNQISRFIPFAILQAPPEYCFYPKNGHCFTFSGHWIAR